MKKDIQIFLYNPDWPRQFELESSHICQVLGANVKAIYHIGSTSVPGLSAKENIDIMCVANNLDSTLCLETIGYKFKGELNIPFRYYFSKNHLEQKVNLHVVEPNHGFIALNLCIRDYLRHNENARLAYEALKYELINDSDSFVRSNNGFPKYTLEKDVFIKSLLDAANFQEIMINMCTHYAEWEAYHRIKEAEIFNPSNIVYDRNHITLTHSNHYHFVMYKGVKIVCVAHIEFLNESEVALRTIATDEPYKRQGYGAYMLKFLERWILTKKVSVIKLHAALNAEKFYRKLGYTEMEFDDPSILSRKIDMGKVLST
jgi:GrpB-like predicted nucleotidyltransferase (UPF0157 family)/N-acetylglutamate synthase-like GNAT family acetyltransferase